MSKVKITVSLPTEEVERARVALRSGRAPSLSAYVAAALAEKTERDDLEGLLDEMLAETGGPLTAVENAKAERAFRPSQRGSAARKDIRDARKK